MQYYFWKMGKMSLGNKNSSLQQKYTNVWYGFDENNWIACVYGSIKMMRPDYGFYESE